MKGSLLLPLLYVVILSISFDLCWSFLPSIRNPDSQRKETSASQSLMRVAPNDDPSSHVTRRAWIVDATKTAFLGVLTIGGSFGVESARAQEDDNGVFSDEELAAAYENPAIPKAPEERSGLTVLRVAEVAQFQEKILRAIVSGELEGVKVAPMQFAYGTKILLQNSNLDGNMKLMIYQEIPRSERAAAIKCAVSALNTLQDLGKYAASIERDFEPIEMLQIADMYRDVRMSLNQMYEYLPPKEKNKYYGYFVAVTDYEKKIAEGTYNPEIDGVLKFDE
jgi:hypothetical protein